jgi:hypothetical protein
MPGFRRDADGGKSIAPLVLVSQRTTSVGSTEATSSPPGLGSPTLSGQSGEDSPPEAADGTIVRVLEIPPAATLGLFPPPRLKAAERAALAVDGVSICFCFCVMIVGVAASVRDL